MELQNFYPLTSAMQCDLILLVQKSSWTMGPSSVRISNSWPLVKGRVRWLTCTSLVGGWSEGVGTRFLAVWVCVREREMMGMT